MDQDIIEVDSETKDMLKMMDFQSIPGLQLTNNRGGPAGNFRNWTWNYLLSIHEKTQKYTKKNVLKNWPKSYFVRLFSHETFGFKMIL